MKIYPSDLSDLVWEKIEVVFKVDYSRGGRPPKHSKREILNGIFYVAKTACQWRFLPTTYPPWKTVYTYFKKWEKAASAHKPEVNYINSLFRLIR